MKILVEAKPWKWLPTFSWRRDLCTRPKGGSESINHLKTNEFILANYILIHWPTMHSWRPPLGHPWDAGQYTLPQTGHMASPMQLYSYPLANYAPWAVRPREKNFIVRGSLRKRRGIGWRLSRGMLGVSESRLIHEELPISTHDDRTLYPRWAVSPGSRSKYRLICQDEFDLWVKSNIKSQICID